MAKTEGRWAKESKGAIPDFWSKLAVELGLTPKTNREQTAQALRGGENERYETAQVIGAIMDRIEALEKPVRKVKSPVLKAKDIKTGPLE